MPREYNVDWENLPKETLAKLIHMFSEHCYLVDGLWFRGVEDEFGLEAALKIDVNIWQRLSSVEAKKIKALFNLGGGGPGEVVWALNFMVLQPCFGPLEVEEKSPSEVIVTWSHCLPQEARKKQGRGEFPCKPTNQTMLENYARIIDPRVKVRCIACPPDPHPAEYWCRWQLTM